MEKNHVISDSLFNEAQAEFEVGRNWIAYNTKTYFLDNADMWFFRDKDEAIDFANDNISDQEAYAVIHASSTISLLRQLPYGEDIHFNLSQQEMENLFQSFDWTEARYDPLYDSKEANTEQEKDELARMETLLAEWENLYKRNPDVALQLAATYWEGKPMEQYKNNFITIKAEFMNEKNFEYLKDNLKYLGFGEKQHEELEKYLKEGKDSFQLTFNADVNKKPFEALLQFRRPENSDLYFLNSYKALLVWSNGEKKEQTFYLNYGKGVTAKEAFNLLSGRSVEKELIRKLNPEEKVQFKAELKLPPEQKGLPGNWDKAPTYKAWLQLDFENKDKHNNFEVKQFHEKFKYDLKEAVGKYAVVELDGGEKEKSLLQSLQKGNLQSVTIEKEGTPVKMFIEANPQYKTVNLYDENLKRVLKEDLAKYQSVQHLTGKEMKQSAGLQQNEAGEGQKRGKQVGKKSQDDIEDSLLPKKRNRQKKGLGL